MTTVRRLGNADDISFSTGLGGVDGATYGTIAILFRPLPDPVWHWLVKLHDISGVELGGVGVLSDGRLYWAGESIWWTEGPAVTFGDWHVLVARKNTGDLKPRFSLQNVATDMWNHADGTETQLDWIAPSGGSIRTKDAASGEGPNADYAAAAFWANELPWAADTTGDAEIEAANLYEHLNNWRDHSPSSGWQFSQTSSSEMVEDFTLNRADETSTGVGTPITATDLDFTFEDVGILALSRNFFRDTQTEPGTGGIIRDLSETQGTSTTLTSAGISGGFTEVFRFWRVVDATVDASVTIDTSIAMSSVSAATLAYRWRVQRYNSAGVLQESSSYSSEHNTFGVKTQTMTLTGPFVAGDRLALSMELRKTSGGGSRTVTLSVNHPNSWVEFSIAEIPSITGTINVIEDSDTLAASGTSVPPPISGTINVTEANDTLAASGTFASPGVTGTIAVTEDDDTLAASGTFVPPPITGTLSVTETDDTLSSSGTFTPAPISGTLSVTEDNDTLAASGTVTTGGVVGSISVTEADDSIVATGTFELPTISGTLSVTETNDTLSATGTFESEGITGSIVVTEENDDLTASGTNTLPTISGILSVTETDDDLIASGTNTTPTFSGTISSNEADDSLVASGTFTSPSITGSVSVTEQSDSLVATGIVTLPVITGSIVVTEENDELEAFESSPIVAAIRIIDVTGPARSVNPNISSGPKIKLNTPTGVNVARVITGVRT